MEIVPNRIKMSIYSWKFLRFVEIFIEIDMLSNNTLEVPLFLKLGVLVDLLDSLFLHPPF